MVLDAFEGSGLDLLVTDSAEQAALMLGDPQVQISGLITDINLSSSMSGWDVACLARNCVGNFPMGYVSGASSHEWPA